METKTEGADPIVISVSGEVDLATAADLERTLSETMAGSSAATIEVDLSQVEFMDSAGLRVLVAARKQAEDAGRTLRLRAPHERVRRIIEITGLAPVFGLDE
ncbi:MULTISPECIES: STAS domain-containing protein [Actinokineospora]|uniref:Anti-sigma factor antagonist n=1 Tax=Actinokineospora fastidiosa TaxID=1816 RepID=A0A918LF58_9PSEU|nr:MULTISPECIES: STAS domain-containing protein [Actinokineospora]UVS80965.1 Anti-anti-sigma-B factor [Actinokineospora sp. UTMC 2448]GGS38580.1 putative anti-sigma factor antagonist [Actinokineospora fastidiosa]